MASFFTDNDDLRWYFDRGIDWAPIVELSEFLYRGPEAVKSPEAAVETYREILELIGQVAAERIAPYAAEIDRQGVRFAGGEATFPPRLQAIFDELAELGMHGLCLPRELGGQSCPMLVFFLANELLARADTSVMAHNSFFGAIAMAMLVYSLQEGSTRFDVERGAVVSTRFAKEIEEIRSGKAWGSMDITEPNAGSDMAALRAKAELDADGTWRLSGQKIFITSGHGKYHFVIARTEQAKDPTDPMAGLAGLSMFLVEAYQEDASGQRTRLVSLDRLEEKLGHHGSATAALSFDRAPARLVGQRGEGFKLMLTLMNNARVGVGFESLGLSEAAYRMAKGYAAERTSMGKPIERHELIADYLDEMESDLEAVRALGVASAVSEELSFKTQAFLDHGFFQGEEEIARRRSIALRHKRRARRFTPLLKYLASEKAVESARRAVQILGGVGYTTEFGAEKLLRDAMVLPIYEGTSQIQSLMAMKDTLGRAMKNPAGFAKRTAQARLRAASARDPLERRVARLSVYALSAQQHLLARTAADKARSLKGSPLSEWPTRFMKNWDPKRDFAYALLHAERLTRLLIDEAVAQLFLEQLEKDRGRAGVLGRYLERAEPRARYLHEQITGGGDRLLEQLSSRDEAATRKAS